MVVDEVYDGFTHTPPREAEGGERERAAWSEATAADDGSAASAGDDSSGRSEDECTEASAAAASAPDLRNATDRHPLDLLLSSSANVIRLFSMSKSYGMPGWRVGYMAYPRELNGAMQKVHACHIHATCMPHACHMHATYMPHVYLHIHIRGPVPPCRMVGGRAHARSAQRPVRPPAHPLTRPHDPRPLFLGRFKTRSPRTQRSPRSVWRYRPSETRGRRG